MSTSDLTGIPRFEDPVYMYRGFPWRLLMRYKDPTGTAYNLTGYTGRFVFRAPDGTFAASIEANPGNGRLTFPPATNATATAALSGGGVAAVLASGASWSACFASGVGAICDGASGLAQGFMPTQ